jgi:hypothetical protein
MRQPMIQQVRMSYNQESIKEESNDEEEEMYNQQNKQKPAK